MSGKNTETKYRVYFTLYDEELFKKILKELDNTLDANIIVHKSTLPEFRYIEIIPLQDKTHIDKSILFNLLSKYREEVSGLRIDEIKIE